VHVPYFQSFVNLKATLLVVESRMPVFETVMLTFSSMYSARPVLYLIRALRFQLSILSQTHSLAHEDPDNQNASKSKSVDCAFVVD